MAKLKIWKEETSLSLWKKLLSPNSYQCRLFFKDFIYLFLERGEGREKDRERNIDVQEKHQLVDSHMPQTEDLACNQGMCPD